MKKAIWFTIVNFLKSAYLKSNMQPFSTFVVRDNNWTFGDVFFTNKWFYSV